MGKIRFLIIGVGGKGRDHISNLLKIPEVEIAGLVDPSENAIKEAIRIHADLVDTPTYSGHDQALAEHKFDAAVIISPHTMHFEQAMACFDAGLHVLLEKPMVCGYDEAKKLIAYSKEKEKHLAVSYQRHLQGPYMYLREIVQNGTLGKINYVAAYQAQRWLVNQTGTWRQKPELSGGGQLNDSGSHLLDAVLWITGLQPKEVTAKMDFRGTEVDIDSSITVKCEQGAMINFDIVGSATTRMYEDISINGDKGTALIRDKKILLAKEGERVPVEVTEEELPTSENMTNNFVNLIIGNVTEPAAPADCGLKVAQLTDAAWLSARLNKTVEVL